MKVEITLYSHNTTASAVVKSIEPELEGISLAHSTISFETNDAEGWLSEGRKEAFEKKYNEEIKGGDVYYIVDKITVSN